MIIPNALRERFGLKPIINKDKRIVELEAQIEILTHFKQPLVIRNEKDTLTFVETVVIEDGVPIDILKEEIARKMVEAAKDHIHYDIEDMENGQRVLTGYLTVVMKD